MCDQASWLTDGNSPNDDDNNQNEMLDVDKDPGEGLNTYDDGYFENEGSDLHYPRRQLKSIDEVDLDEEDEEYNVFGSLDSGISTGIQMFKMDDLDIYSIDDYPEDNYDYYQDEMYDQYNELADDYYLQYDDKYYQDEMGDYDIYSIDDYPEDDYDYYQDEMYDQYNELADDYYLQYDDEYYQDEMGDYDIYSIDDYPEDDYDYYQDEMYDQYDELADDYYLQYDDEYYQDEMDDYYIYSIDDYPEDDYDYYQDEMYDQYNELADDYYLQYDDEYYQDEMDDYYIYSIDDYPEDDYDYYQDEMYDQYNELADDYYLQYDDEYYQDEMDDYYMYSIDDYPEDDYDYYQDEMYDQYNELADDYYLQYDDEYYQDEMDDYYIYSIDDYPEDDYDYYQDEMYDQYNELADDYYLQYDDEYYQDEMDDYYMYSIDDYPEDDYDYYQDEMYDQYSELADDYYLQYDDEYYQDEMDDYYMYSIDDYPEDDYDYYQDEMYDQYNELADDYYLQYDDEYYQDEMYDQYNELADDYYLQYDDEYYQDEMDDYYMYSIDDYPEDDYDYYQDEMYDQYDELADDYYLQYDDEYYQDEMDDHDIYSIDDYPEDDYDYYPDEMDDHDINSLNSYVSKDEKISFSHAHGMIIRCKSVENSAVFKLLTTEIWDETRNEKQMRHIVTVDFCGDPLRYGLHQVFLKSSTICIFAIDMKKALNATLETECSGSNFQRMTYKDTLLLWFRFIQDFSKSQTKIVIFGANAEGFAEKDISVFFEDIFQFLKEENLDKISASIELTFTDNSLQKGNETCFVLVSKIRSVIGSQTLEKTIPIRWKSWFNELAKVSNEHKMIKLDKLWTINNGFDENVRLESLKEIKLALNCLSDVGGIHFEEKLSDIVILAIQWFVDVVSSKIMSIPSGTGEIHVEQINEILLQENEEIYDIRLNLLSYLEAVGLASRFPSVDIWYFPYLNTRVFSCKDFEIFQPSSTLSFRFNCHAKFIFNTLVSICVSKSKWSVLQDGGINCLYQSAAVFVVENHNILLYTYGNEVKVQILWLKQIQVNLKLTSNAKARICTLLNGMDLRTHENGISYQIGFACENGKDNFISFEEVHEMDIIQCPKCPVRSLHTIDVPSIKRFWDFEEDDNDCKCCEKDNISPSRTDCTLFRKSSFYANDAITSDLKSNVSKSIGMIRLRENPQGTGFRVGENLIMTNWHVVKPNLTRTTVGPEEKLSDYNIVFDVKVRNEPLLPKNYFDFEPFIHFIDVELDIVILELKQHEFPDVNFPPAIQCFGEIDFEKEIHLIGHSGGNQMKEDSCVQPMIRNKDTHDYILSLEQWSIRHLPNGENFYSALHDKHKVLLHTTFDRGSSGSPGININGREAIVVLMLSGGVPTCFYDGLYTKVPHNKLVEYGVSMTDIYEKLRDMNETLCMKVFNLSSL
uniref:Uncharacterized protein LOC111119378 isoform X3 n=1 Tax=Crassostrea virginica TaxID=6565 RepID=A0A8B8CLG2_CRAVI|nr:uncharacterized protein LOC111119378 isoform X3 [Crassostrea virginica]